MFYILHISSGLDVVIVLFLLTMLQSLRDIDYTIEDKLIFESILRVEFKDGAEKGFFYNGKDI